MCYELCQMNRQCSIFYNRGLAVWSQLPGYTTVPVKQLLMICAFPSAHARYFILLWLPSVQLSSCVSLPIQVQKEDLWKIVLPGDYF